MSLRHQLAEFSSQHKIASSKGALCVMLVVTRHARPHGQPIDPDGLVTEQGGQVRGLCRGAVQSILKAHGIDKVLAQEGGRTSRGSLGTMRTYIGFLNHLGSDPDLEAIEGWWVERVRDYFRAKPLRLRVPSGGSLGIALNDLFAEAAKKQDGGTMVVGAIYQHLVGAKLEILFPGSKIGHHGFSVADQQTGRSADFLVGDTAIHVTTTPTESLIAKCEANRAGGKRVMIITSSPGARLCPKPRRRQPRPSCSRRFGTRSVFGHQRRRMERIRIGKTSLIPPRSHRCLQQDHRRARDRSQFENRAGVMARSYFPTHGSNMRISTILTAPSRLDITLKDQADPR